MSYHQARRPDQGARAAPVRLVRPHQAVVHVRDVQLRAGRGAPHRVHGQAGVQDHQLSRRRVGANSQQRRRGAEVHRGSQHRLPDGVVAVAGDNPGPGAQAAGLPVLRSRGKVAVAPQVHTERRGASQVPGQQQARGRGRVPGREKDGFAAQAKGRCGTMARGDARQHHLQGKHLHTVGVRRGDAAQAQLVVVPLALQPGKLLPPVTVHNVGQRVGRAVGWWR